jgi:very-short-patch-repair endonuclease
VPPTIRRRYLRLAPDERTQRRRIPVTTLARTIFDLAAETSVEGLEAAVREAEYRHRFRIESLANMAARHPGNRGVSTVKSCLHHAGRGPRGRARSKLETRFASLLARSDLPQPELNALLDLGDQKIEADCLWRAQRLIAELDGGKTHGTRAAFDLDRERDRRLQALGWRVVRITWRQLNEPAAVLTDLHRLLAG